jgi:hypothetical protein
MPDTTVPRRTSHLKDPLTSQRCKMENVRRLDRVPAGCAIHATSRGQPPIPDCMSPRELERQVAKRVE